MKRIVILVSIILLLFILNSCKKNETEDTDSKPNPIQSNLRTDNITNNPKENNINQTNADKKERSATEKKGDFDISKNFTWDDYVEYAKEIGSVSITLENYFNAYYFTTEKYLVSCKSDTSFKYAIYENGAAIISEYLGTNNNIIFPDSIDEHPVVGIGKLELRETRSYKMASLKKEKINVTLGKNTLFVCGDAFNRCQKSLNEITLNDGLKVIFSSAFCLSETISKINFPSSLVEIGDMAFYDCKNLRSIDLSKTQIAKISAKSFSECTNLSEIVLPNSVCRIELEAFLGDSVLSKINVPTELMEVDTKAFDETKIDTSIFLKNHIAFSDNLTFYNDPAIHLPN